MNRDELKDCVREVLKEWSKQDLVPDGKRVLNANIVAGVTTFQAVIEKDTASILVYGSSDGGAAKQAMHTDADGDVQVDLLSAIPAGENFIGIFGKSAFQQKTDQVTNASAYDAGDSVGGKITLANAVRISGGTGKLDSVMIIDKAAQNAEMDLLIFDADPSAATITDDQPFVFSTDIAKLIAKVKILSSDYTTFGTISTAELSGLGKIVKANGSTNLYAALVTSGTPTYTGTDDITVIVGIEQN